VDRVAIALGSNVGDRAAHLDFAVSRLRHFLDELRISQYYETEPVGVIGVQPLFLNAAAVGGTTQSARAVLDELLAIERVRGRERPFGDAVIDEPDLVVPHPRFRERRFVLEPLAAIAPHLVDPVTQLTVVELLDRIRF
jgi:2-amino-4-hydroxy-6-hydroxymethyldihydropteridine diphosphokinase